MARNRIKDVNIEDLEYGTESESESESEEVSSTDSKNESFSSFESDGESEVSSQKTTFLQITLNFDFKQFFMVISTNDVLKI